MPQNKKDHNSTTHDFGTSISDTQNLNNQDYYTDRSKPNDNHYNQNYYNPNQYQNNGYYQNNKRSSNSSVIILISILSVVLIIAVTVLALVFTGVISLGSRSSSNISTESSSQILLDPLPSASPAAAPIPENTIVSAYKYVANVDYSIYFRSAPAEVDSNIICEIPLGTLIGFIENPDATFAKINYNGSIGYVKQAYLSSDYPIINNYINWNSPMRVVNVKNSIYLRSTPSESSDSNIIMEIPVGSTVYYQDTPNGTFYKIYYNGTTGYSKQDYLSFDMQSSYKSSSNTMTVVNVKNSIYLRSSASESSDSNIITEIPVGSTVTYLGTPNTSFYKISYGGTVGYSKQIYLSFN